MTNFKHLKKSLTHHNCTREDIKSKLNSGNAVIEFGILSSRLVFKNLKIKIYKTADSDFVGLSHYGKNIN